MGNQSPSAATLSNLALACSALARAGQVLSAVSDPARAAEALQQAAGLLQGDPRVASMPGVADLAARCKSLGPASATHQLVSQCRQMATAMARHASSLAQQIEQQSKGLKPAVAPSPAPVPAPAPAPAPVPASIPLPEPEPIPVAMPEPEPTPVLEPELATVEPAEPVEQPPPPERPGVPRELVESLTIARTAQEKAVVQKALEDGRRFAWVGNGTVIDTRTNLMWAARLSPPGDYAAAEAYVGDLRTANYTGWRLPRASELQQLFAQGGSEALMEEGGLSPDAGEWICTSESRRRFIFFGHVVTCLCPQTGSFSAQKASSTKLRVLGVRG